MRALGFESNWINKCFLENNEYYMKKQLSNEEEFDINQDEEMITKNRMQITRITVIHIMVKLIALTLKSIWSLSWKNPDVQMWERLSSKYSLLRAGIVILNATPLPRYIHPRRRKTINTFHKSLAIMKITNWYKCI